MFYKLCPSVVRSFWKRNSKGIFYLSGSVAGASAFYFLQNESVDGFLTVDKMPHHAAFFGRSNSLELDDCICETITGADNLNATKDLMKSKMEAFVTNLQGQLVKKLEEFEPEHKFEVDRWMRKEGGGGITCIIQDGQVFERAAVNISVVNGVLPQGAVNQMRSRGKKTIPAGKSLPFFACGISSVIHPRNPNVPTLHFNYRYFEVEIGEGKHESWFGGGTDLTPYYLDESDVKQFHTTLKRACDRHDKSLYGKFKKWCDDYFVIKHRGECRGVGGIFFDDLDDPNKQKTFEFVKSCANAVMPSYLPIIEKNKTKGYGLKERDWQLLRRGRYVEFNLVYDRGTKFGLETPGAKIESILVSLPLSAKWSYKHVPEKGSDEEKLMEILKNPREWAK